jgi:cytochrome c-type biogenesis protein CcmH
MRVLTHVLRAAAVVFVLLALPAAVTAQSGARTPAPSRTTDVAETQLDRDVRALAAELRCPVCQGLSLQDSPSELSQEMKDVIRSQLAAGRTKDEVKAYFVSKYGEWILMEPKPQGFNLAVYLLPVIGLVAGAIFVFLTARRWVRQGSERTETAVVAADASID